MSKSTYQAMVEANLRQMNAPAIEWRPVPTSGQTEAEDDRGRQVIMPIFQFPEGYTKAPTVYPNLAGDMHCELCGKDIRYAYHIQNDDKRWTMMVGSECVTHFGLGVNGEKVFKMNVAEQNREFIKRLERVRQKMYRLATYDAVQRDSMGQQRAIRRFATHTIQGGTAARYYSALCCKGSTAQVPTCYIKNLGDWHDPLQVIDIIPSAGSDKFGYLFSDRRIANWLKKHRPAAEAYLSEVLGVFPGADEVEIIEVKINEPDQKS